MTDLFSPIALLGTTLPNRIVMSAMTRTRATETGVPTDLMREYYVQRASAGLIVTECTQVSNQAHGIIGCPGIHTDDQIAGWRRVTDAVHGANGRIVCQIWHCGRVAHPDMRGGEAPVGPSPIAASGDFFLPRGRVEFPIPRELEVDEMGPIVKTFEQASRNARAAGFDGVELHAANGYLQDQFLQDGSNHRNDPYGGAIANRARLTLETIDAMIAGWDHAHVGIRLSPSSSLYGMHDSNPAATFAYLVKELDSRQLAYLCLLEPNEKDAPAAKMPHVLATLRPLIKTAVIGNTGFNKSTACHALASGLADAIAFGVPFIANPDLVLRLERDAALAKPNPKTFYGEGPAGYTDYPTL